MPSPDNDQPPLVAHLIFRLTIGGLENGLVNLVNWMPREKYRHVIICLTDSSDFSQRIERDDVVIHALHKKPGKDLLVHWRLWKLLRKLKPQLLHTRNLGTLEFVVTAALAGIPCRVHGEHGWNAGDPHGRVWRYRFLRRVCSPLVARVITVSAHMRRWVTREIGNKENRVVHIYNGVDTRRFRPGSERLPHQVPDDAFVVGMVARLDPIKDPITLLRAFARVRERYTNAYLVIVGNGPLFGQIEAHVDEAGLTDSVWLAGARDDIPALLRGMDVFVLPSLNEGISNTILEAMATGLPVIATSVGGNPELVVLGETGSLFELGDVPGLAAHLEAYAGSDSLRRQHGAAARRRVEATFSPQAMVDGYVSLYDRLTMAGV